VLERSHLILQSKIYLVLYSTRKSKIPDDVNLQDFIPSEMVVNRRKGRKCVG
jgi:hypothetical protein